MNLTTEKSKVGGSRSWRFLNGVVILYGYQGLLLITGLWLTPFFLHRIGQQDYGLWLVGTQLLAYLALADLGVVALLPQQTAYATGRSGGVENADGLPQLVGETTRLVLCQLPLVMVVAAALWFTVPAEWNRLRGPMIVVLLGYVAVFPLRIIPALLHGLQDLWFANVMQVLGWAISTGLTVLMVMRGWSLYALAIGWLISQTLLTPVLYYRLRTRFPQVMPRRLPPLAWDAVRSQLGRGGWVTVSQIAQALVSNTDMLIIGRVLGPAAVVPYAITGKLAGVLANQAQILMQTATPGLCELKTGGSRERLFTALAGLNHILMAFSGLVFCVVLLVNHWFVGWWVSAAQFGGLRLTVAILVNMLFMHWNTVAAYSVFCLGLQRRIALTNLATGLVTAGTCLALTGFLGVIGAPLGSLAGTCLVGLPLNLWIIARETDVSIVRLIRAMIGSWSWRFALLGSAAVLIAARWAPTGVAEAAGAAIGISAVYLLVMIPSAMRSPLGDYIRQLTSVLRMKYGFAVRVS